MRSIAYIVIVALTATQGKGMGPRDVKLIFEPTVSVKGCADDDTTIRCNPGGGKDGWENTVQCMNELGITRDCYCWGNQRFYAVANNNFAEFEACCSRQSGSLGIGGQC